MKLYLSTSLLDQSVFDGLDALNEEPIEKIGNFLGMDFYVDHTLPDNTIQVTDKYFKVLGSITVAPTV